MCYWMRVLVIFCQTLNLEDRKNKDFMVKKNIFELKTKLD